ncbi:MULTISPECIES: hypothetical protein [unclassified Mesobacillus]|uniref:hypothetical protein n=1 Tax=unclassified Mesobacillus TaxID=2675270 RepID=UPI00203D324C|nr:MULTISPECIES: hypothetical protein [unclassified Mesobacillus]MCM3123840.1 hypothetical protein [Mesobacillus sp. MER 33]MCM3234145.1 hypothetical protein [Mesobacillus sp. MER 48]
MKQESPFVDHGIPVEAEEARAAAFCERDGKYRFVVSARGFVLIVDPDAGTSKQVHFPDGNDEYPFSSFSSNGLFYTGAGKMLLVLDPFSEEFIFQTSIKNGEEIVGFSFAEDDRGYIFFSSYPHCHLLRYDPSSHEVIDYGSMDSVEKYPGSLAVDHDGWVYMGIGTEHKNIVAYHPGTGERKELIPEHMSTKGAGYVYAGTDGYVYGHWEAADLKDVHDSTRWLRFLAGEAQDWPVNELSSSRYTGSGFQKIHRNRETPYRVAAFSLSERYADFCYKVTGETNRISLHYRSAGANLSTLCKGPDGCLYGTSMHPLQLFRYDFDKGELVNFGGEVVEQGGGGNIAAYADQGGILYGAAYAGGKLYKIDLQQPFMKGVNPRIMQHTEEIHRPRCAISLRDGKHVVWGGFPGYGMVGGGLGIYDTVTDRHTILDHLQLIENQSTLCLGELRSGLILGGTSIETPGGANSLEKEACLYVLDWKDNRIVDKFVPIKGTREISQMFIDPYERVHCLTNEGIYFVYDLQNMGILYQQDLSLWGGVVRNGFVFIEGSHRLLVLLSRTLLAVRIGQDSIAEPKVVSGLQKSATSGVVLHDGRIYYGSGSHLCSIDARDI